MPDSIAKPDYADNGWPASEQAIKSSSHIQVLSDSEILKMRTVCKLSREILEIGASVIKVGATTDEIDRAVHNACIGT